LTVAQKGLALLEPFAMEASAPADLRRELAASTTRVADLLASTGNINAALEHRRRALAIMEALSAASPDDPANQRQLGVAYQKLGNTLGNPNAPNVGDFQGGLEQLEKAAVVMRRAIAAHPDNTLFRRILAVVDSNTADVLVALKRPQEALSRMHKAIDGFNALAVADPTNAAAQNDVAIACSNWARCSMPAAIPGRRSRPTSGRWPFTSGSPRATPPTTR
jgi:tetratricopeptide (TPR) repeat protein